MKRDIAVIDLFCGAGGLSLGLQQSGLTIAAGVDLDPYCRFAFEQNIKAPFIHRDVSSITARELLRYFGRSQVKVLAACAPCQPFSGYTTKRRELDLRWKLLFEVQRLAIDALPDIITVENVSRLARQRLWTEFVKALERAGYYVAWNILDASSFGVPQRRKRLVLLASRLGPITLPEPTSRSFVTVRTAIGALPNIKFGVSSARDPLHCSRRLSEANLLRIRASKPAGTWKQWPNKLVAKCHTRKTGRTYPSVYGRMSWDQPSPTITTQFYGFGNGRFGHPQQDRAISLREGAILQSFPRSFVFCPKSERVNFNAIGRLIGNAVPPKLAKAIGSAIIAHAAAMAGGASRNSPAFK